MAKFRGLHVMAGIAAMIVAALLGSAMGLNNTAVVTSSCVVFVAVSMWVDSIVSRRRRAASTLEEQQGRGPQLVQQSLAQPAPEPQALQQPAPQQPAQQPVKQPLQQPRQMTPREHPQDNIRPAQRRTPHKETSKREGNAA
ncbi:hypothetical protein [Pseudarthrobacter sp. N5]|uniref:hypothetical protein n=1 Tax=Pseudarthrobacter sp. N5 TaxID=3418416 RepID=UPI003CF197C8